jgi:hypothetical protein
VDDVSDKITVGGELVMVGVSGCCVAGCVVAGAYSVAVLKLLVEVEYSETESESELGHSLAVWKDVVVVSGALESESSCLSGWVHQRYRRDCWMSCCCWLMAFMHSWRMERVATYVVIVFCRTLM